MTEEEQLRKRFLELADRAYSTSRYQFTGFLNLMEISLFLQTAHEFPHVPFTLFGGAEGCERQMARLGSEEMMGYEETFPIRCIKAEPLSPRFADVLSHRDFLGALMNLGVERSTIGDIVISDNAGYIFCAERMAGFLAGELTQVKHTHIRCSVTEQLPEGSFRKMEEIAVQIPSGRIDALVAKVYNLSRGDSQELFQGKKVFVDGRLCENNSYPVKDGETVSVRGYGKFRFLRTNGVTKKGKLSVTVGKYV